MSLHLQRFVDRVQSQEIRGQKDFIMSMTDAQSLHADLTRVLIELDTMRKQIAQVSQDQIVTVHMDGGRF